MSAYYPPGSDSVEVPSGIFNITSATLATSQRPRSSVGIDVGAHRQYARHVPVGLDVEHRHFGALHCVAGVPARVRVIFGKTSLVARGCGLVRQKGV